MSTMFSQDWTLRKRGREFEDDYTPGFAEHRQKRHIASLPHRGSPNIAKKLLSPTVISSFTSQPSPSTITPADSDSEEPPTEAQQDRSAFSPWSSSPSATYRMADSQSSSISYSAGYADDMEMSDTVQMSPGLSFTTDAAPSVTGRIPTPIYSSFAPLPFVRVTEKPRNDPEFADDQTMIERIRRGRRLPSPISEGETSPSVIVEGLGEMQMEVEPTPTKKGHTRSKHSLRSWTGYGADMSGNIFPVKRSFSMGYRSDCEKCRMKVPGHFSHIITYD